MPKHKKQIKVVDYRSVNLAWLVAFKDRVFNKELAPEIELVVAREDIGFGSQFEIHEGDTFCVTGETATAYTVSRPYGDARTGEVVKSIVKPKPREDWSTEDVAEYVIKRACLADQCTYLEVIEQPKKNVSRNEYRGTFVSQARRCRFADLVGALHHFYTLKQAKIADQYVWLDIFSANQPKLTACNVEPAVRKENERQLTEGLHIAIANFEQRVMFMDKWDRAAPLTRAWCVWEIFGVAKAKKQLEIALPESEYDRYISFMIRDFFNVKTKLSKIEVEKAECFSEQDLQMIQGAIRKESSYAQVNDVVMSQLRVWVASTAEAEMRKEEAKASPDESRIGLLATCAGLTFKGQGQYNRAEKLLRKGLAISKRINGLEHAETATSLNNLASLLYTQGKLSEAEPLMREAMRIRKKTLGEQHPLYASDLNNLAQLLQARGKLDDAEPLLREVLRIDEKVLGKEHTNYAMDLNNLAGLLEAQGKLDKAKPLYEESLHIRRKVYGNEHPAVATTLNNLALLLQARGKLDDAEPLLREVLRIDEKVLGKEHPNYAMDLNNLALLLKAQGKLAEAEPLYRQALAIDKKVYGAEHHEVATDLNNLALLLWNQDKNSKEADRLGKEALRIAEKVLGKDHPTTQNYRRDWG